MVLKPLQTEIKAFAHEQTKAETSISIHSPCTPNIIYLSRMHCILSVMSPTMEFTKCLPHLTAMFVREIKPTLYFQSLSTKQTCKTFSFLFLIFT